MSDGRKGLWKKYGLQPLRHFIETIVPDDIPEKEKRDYRHVVIIVLLGLTISLVYGSLYLFWDHPVANIGFISTIFVFIGLATSLIWIRLHQATIAIFQLIACTFLTLTFLSFAFGKLMNLHYYFVIVSAGTHILHPKKNKWLSIAYGYIGVILLLILETTLPDHPFWGPPIDKNYAALSRAMALGFTYLTVTSYIWWSLRINERVTDELAQEKSNIEATKAVQAALLESVPDHPNFTIRSRYQPAETAGGDWLSAHYDEEEKWLFLYLGDVTGHGISSALVTAAVAGAAAATVSRLQGGGGRQLHQVVDQLCLAMHAAVLRTGTPSGRLMTLAILGIDLSTGEVHYRNAGHTPIYWISDERIHTVIEGGSPLGFHQTPRLGKRQFTMHEGDRIFIYSDGLLSNQDGEGQKVSWKILRDKLAQFPEPEALIAQISQFIDGFVRDTDSDDTACIAFRWRKTA